MANKSLTDLTARTATADSDLLHINSGGTDYKQSKSDFIANLDKHITFGTSSSLSSQVDALASGRYFGFILSYGHQTETGMPLDSHFYVEVQKQDGNNIIVTAVSRGTIPRTFQMAKANSWGSWIEMPNRSEITSLNNSLANSLVKNPSNIASYNEFDALATSGGFYAFRLSESFTIGGVALPNYGRGLIMNYSSTDSSFIYVSPDGFWFGFKKNGTWYVKRASTF